MYVIAVSKLTVRGIHPRKPLYDKSLQWRNDRCIENKPTEGQVHRIDKYLVNRTF